MNEGTLTGVDMAQKLGAIGKFTGTTQAATGATHISSLTGNFDIKNGVATTNDLNALTDAGTMAAAGTISLVDQGLNLSATAVLSQASSKQVGGSSIGGLMSTAMENNKGEIVIPVLVRGTIPNPKVEPDLNQMAKMRVTNMLPTFNNPGQLAQEVEQGISGNPGQVLNSITGKAPGAAANNQQGGNTSQQQGRSPGAAPNNQQQPGADSIQDVVNGLDGLFGGKKK
jgi:hypothetical protein